MTDPGQKMSWFLPFGCLPCVECGVDRWSLGKATALGLPWEGGGGFSRPDPPWHLNCMVLQNQAAAQLWDSEQAGL